jgi:hypothetical protein
MSQDDLNVLYNTEMDDFVPMFTALFHEVNSLNAGEVFKMF